MHYGFAMPILSMPLIVVAALFVPGIVGDAIVGIWFGGQILGWSFTKRRASGQIRRWARSHGISNVTKLPRGGFVSWGFTFWTFAEMDWYQGTGSQDETRKFVASYMGHAFGLIVTTHCEEEPVNEPNEQVR